MLCNILLDKLPMQSPHGYKLKTNYRQGIKYELLMQDNELTVEEKIDLALNIFFYKQDLAKIKKEEELISFLEDIIWFYRCGKKETKKTNKTRKGKQIFSYDFDADIIYSAFFQQYNIDLQVENLHWWQFKSMFESLTDETQIVQIMQYRATDLSKIKDKTERKRIKELQDLYKLPDMRTEEEKENDFANQFL